ncbi:hypothetical protein PV325_009867 [Microctonus aethiopoides]|nr:hypothetical protein PV325_009867 [Microctonus aethiopoides]
MRLLRKKKRNSRANSNTGGSDGNGSASTSSPGNKRRGFSGRKWLPQPLRKLSQGKVEKSSSTTADRPSPLKKTGSDKRFKLPTGDKTGRAVSEGEEEEEVECDDGEQPPFLEQNGGEDADDDFELPPPMKPITEPILVAAGNGPPGSTIPDELPGKRTSERSIKSLDGATTADLAEIEQIVKERMEQHTENQERHSLMRTPGRPSSTDDGYSGISGGPTISEETDPEAAALAKRQFVIRELADTERDYVNDLKLIVEGYIAIMRDPDSEIPLPEDLRGGKDKMVFGNIEAIYEWHRDFFMKALERCLERPEELGPLFKRYERKLHMYVVYCQNKPVSEYIVSEYIDTYFEELRQKLGHRLQLCDLLIKPVQRITKYQLILREALRLTEKTQRISEIEGLRAAAHVMRVIPKAANDMMDVGRLQGFDGKITAQGKLLLHGPLSVAELSSLPPRGREWQVFLFEQNIIFSEAQGKKTQFTSPAYTYKAHIQVNKMSLEDSPDDAEKFIIRSTDPRKPGLGFICGVIDDNGPRRQEWVDTITAILQTQRDFLKAIQSPIAYQKELTKDPLRSTTPEPISRTATSVPPMLTVPGASNKERSNGQRKTQPIHRSHTVGLDGGETPRTPSPTKSKLNFLEGFKNTLRARSPVRTNSIPVAPGARVRLAADWGKLHAGDELVVSHLDGPGVVVSPLDAKEELWIPASLIPNSSISRAWSFRPRKSENEKQITSPQRGINDRKILPPPRILSGNSLSSVRVAAGDIARLSVEVANIEGAHVAWRKNGIHHDIDIDDRHQMRQSAGLVYLEIARCCLDDAGTYECIIDAESGSCSIKISLYVTGDNGATWARILGPTKVKVDWEKRDIERGTLEYRTIPSTAWIPIVEDVKHPPIILELPAGASYSFRIVNKHLENGGTSPSAIVTLPLDESMSWEAEQFVGRYLELDELGKGRYALVRRARDRGTGQEVALKQTPRHKQSRSLTRAEYDLLASTHHGNIIRAFALFENAPQPGLDTIVLEFKKTDYTEAMASKYANQLLSALQWLHQRNKYHLDVKPENVLVDQDTGIVKLIDLGEAVRGPVDEVVPPADLEFAAPELVLGRPTGAYTDMWAAGVFIYVLLSGLSPFLDDSVEETTANILKCDFCFPDEYFESISNDAKNLLSRLLYLRGEERATAEFSLASPWLKVSKGATIPSSRMAAFIERRTHCSKSHTDHNDSFYS